MLAVIAYPYTAQVVFRKPCYVRSLNAGILVILVF